jgi:uncharacterized membrane protein
VAVSTGDLAGELAERTSQVSATLERHESLAETTRTAFALLTVMFIAMLGAPLLRRREWSNGLYVALSTVFLVFYAAGTVTLVNTAHLGGQLVHRYGVHAMRRQPLRIGMTTTGDVAAGVTNEVARGRARSAWRTR